MRSSHAALAVCLLATVVSSMETWEGETEETLAPFDNAEDKDALLSLLGYREDSMGKRSLALGRYNFRPGKRSLALGRSHFRPGKRSLALETFERPAKRSLALGRNGFRPGKRSVDIMGPY